MKVARATVAVILVFAAACGRRGSTTTMPAGDGSAECGAMGAACSGITCCTGFSCIGGQCSCAAHEGDVCNADSACCAGLSCDATNHCRMPCNSEAGACHALGEMCASDADCCAPGTCHLGNCRGTFLPATCASEGIACLADTDCCGSLDAGSRYACVSASDGGRVCHLGSAGESCDPSKPCSPGQTCIASVDGGVEGGSNSEAGGGAQVGVCGVVSMPSVCTLLSGSCAVWDTCDPENGTNQGYDPCFYRAQGQTLSPRPQILTCHGGRCNYPIQGEACTATCIQTAGDPRPTQCVGILDGTNMCLPLCNVDADCSGALAVDSKNNNPPLLTTYCVGYGSAAQACQPLVCYVGGQAGEDKPSMLYRPCPGRPNTLCIPQFVGTTSSILGFCQAVKPGATSTVGKVCSQREGRESQEGLCGKDALCLGGVCQKICDASQLGAAGTPACDPAETCLTTQGVNLVADYQVGGCGTPCDPFADEDHSGCANFCGGPPSKCYWIIGDAVANQPRGYCGAAAAHPIAAGQACGPSSVEPCEGGAYCLLNSDGITTSCAKLCDPTAASGSPDSCPKGKRCAAFPPLKHSGQCM